MGIENGNEKASPREKFSIEEPGWFEKLGIKYFFALSERDRKKGVRYKKADSDDEMVSSVRKVTFLGIIVAFIIGGISSGGSVAMEEYFPANSCDVLLSKSCLIKYGWVAIVTLVLTLIEFAVLFWVAIRTVFFISRITGHSELESSDTFGAHIPNLLSRAALEIPDPILEMFNIDPLRNVSKKKMIVVGILYKLKIMLSNVLMKLFLRRVVGKSVVRGVSIAYISVIITGLWNSLVILKVAKEARLRLFGNLLARYLVKENITDEKLNRLSSLARIGCLQALGNSIVLTQNYHPNMVVLLLQFSKLFGYEGGEVLDDWNTFIDTLNKVSEQEKFFILDLLAVATAFDGKISRLEKKTLGDAFQEHTEVYFKRIIRLKNLMMSGRLYEAIKECELDFEAG